MTSLPSAPADAPIVGSGRRPRGSQGPHGKVVEGLGYAIVSGSLAAGTLIFIADLQAEFRVSRTVMREALRVLSDKGLVESRQRKGTTVLGTDRWKLLDPDVLRWRRNSSGIDELMENLAEVRLLIEPAAAAAAAERATAEELDAIGLALARLADAVAARDPDAVVSADVEFHHRIAIAAHNPLLIEMTGVLLGALAGRDAVAIEALGFPRYLVPRHRAVLKAIIARNAERAHAEMTTLVNLAQRDARRLATSRRSHAARGNGKPRARR
ncbi:MAG: FCD domain-containing protein [Gaiellales bacterium]